MTWARSRNAYVRNFVWAEGRKEEATTTYPANSVRVFQNCGLISVVQVIAVTGKKVDQFEK